MILDLEITMRSQSHFCLLKSNQNAVFNQQHSNTSPTPNISFDYFGMWRIIDVCMWNVIYQVEYIQLTILLFTAKEQKIEFISLALNQGKTSAFSFSSRICIRRSTILFSSTCLLLKLIIYPHFHSFFSHSSLFSTLHLSFSLTLFDRCLPILIFGRPLFTLYLHTSFTETWSIILKWFIAQTNLNWPYRFHSKQK